MNNRLFLILVFIIVGSFTGSAQSATAVQGTGSETISRIIHDRDGNILFASHHGVYRYDGRIVMPLFAGNISVSDIAYDNDTLFFAADKGFGGMIDRSGGISYFGEQENDETERVLPLPDNRVVFTTDDGLILYDCNDKKQISSFIEPISPTSSTNNVHLEFDPDRGVIWFVTPDFIILLDRNLTEMSYAVFEDNTDPSAIFFDRSEHQLLIGTNNGLYSISYDMILKKEHFLAGKQILFVVEDENDSIIVGAADSGLYIYNDPHHTQILPDVKLHTDICICHVFKNCIWLAINGMGVVYYPYNSGPLNELQEQFLHKQIQSIFHDTSGNVWVHANGNLYVIRNKDRSVHRVTISDNNSERILGLFVTSYDYMIVISNRKILVYRIENGNIVFIQSMKLNEYITGCREDIEGNIILATRNQYYHMRKETGNLTLLPSEHIPDATCIPLGITLRITGERSFEVMSGKTGHVHTVADDVMIDKIFITDNGTTWLWDSRRSQLLRYDLRDERIDGRWKVIDAQINGLQEDARGNTWFATSMGLMCIYNDSSVRYFNIGMTYDYNSLCTSSNDGDMFFAYSNGLTVFSPSNPYTLVPLDNMDFSIPSVSINGKKIGRIDSRGEFFASGDNYDPTRKLDYRQNNISFSCSVSDMSNLQVPYMYRLEGYDQEWIQSSSSDILYSNLPEGKYTFHFSLPGSADGQAKMFSFEIAKAPWKTWWANCFCFICLVAFSFILYLLYQSIRVNREREVRERVSKMKIDFFTDISHELRSPLTLISGPMKNLMNETSLSESARKKIVLMDRSVQKLLRLSNQILEYNNVEREYARLNLKDSDMMTIIGDMVENFHYNLAEKQLRVSIVGESSLRCMLDQIKIGRVVSNLLSNAIKYSYSGTSIVIEVTQDDGCNLEETYGKTLGNGRYIEVKVIDEGMGIPEGKYESVFRKYERLESENDRINISGYGIGLYYTRQLILAHKGYIKAEKNNPNGSVFRFIIPLVPVLEESCPEVEPEPYIDMDTAIVGDEHEKACILVVDDEADMRQYLDGLLSEHYNVICVQNADQALEKMHQRYFNMVISDVMMAGTDGYALCHKIKSDDGLCSVPVILLTAKADVNSQIHGLNMGADAYVSKPFDPDYLIARIRNILMASQRRQEILTHTTSQTIDDSAVKASIDNQTDLTFMKKLYTVLDNHLSDNEVDLGMIAKEMGLSKSGIFVKLKSLTGKAPSVFFCEYKMKRAVEMMHSCEYNIKEISYLVGFEARQSFTRSFKRVYGCTPTEFLARENISLPQSRYSSDDDYDSEEEI